MPIADGGWSVRLPERIHSTVNEIAEAEERSAAQVVRRLVIEALEARKRNSSALSRDGGAA